MYQPPTSVPTDPAQLSQFLLDQLRQLSQGIAAPGSIQLDPLGKAPAKPRNGLTVYANGTTWNPGSGAGVYTWRDGAWRFLG